MFYLAAMKKKAKLVIEMQKEKKECHENELQNVCNVCGCKNRACDCYLEVKDKIIPKKQESRFE